MFRSKRNDEWVKEMGKSSIMWCEIDCEKTMSFWFGSDYLYSSDENKQLTLFTIRFDAIFFSTFYCWCYCWSPLLIKKRFDFGRNRKSKCISVCRQYQTNIRFVHCIASRIFVCFFLSSIIMFLLLQLCRRSNLL